MKFSSTQILYLIAIAFLLLFIANIFEIDTLVINSLSNYCRACS